MAQNTQIISRRPARKPRPVPGVFAFALLDAIDQLLEEKAYAQTRAIYGCDHDPLEPAACRARARFWREVTQQIDGWGGAPPAIAEELRVRCQEVAP